MGFPVGARGKEPTCQFRRHKRHRFDPCVGKIPWRRKWQSNAVFLPGESHGQKSLAGCKGRHGVAKSLTRLKHLRLLACLKEYISRWMEERCVRDRKKGKRQTDRQTDIAKGQAESISLPPDREICMPMSSLGHNHPPTPDSQKRQTTPPFHAQLVISAVRQLTCSPWRDSPEKLEYTPCAFRCKSRHSELNQQPGLRDKLHLEIVFMYQKTNYCQVPPQ